MPGILINRLSRPKAGETPEQQLEKSRLILFEEMLPVICPGASEGQDYVYLSDIQSRLKVHEEGEILDETFRIIRSGRCSWIAVTEIARISGDMTASGKLIELCSNHRVAIFTREKLHYPYEPWRAASKRDLMTQFFISGLEVLSYQERMERTRDVAYPTFENTGASRLRNVSKGLGRHLNGIVPRGYLWNKTLKKVELDESIPFPNFIPEGKSEPTGMKMWEIIRYLRLLGLTYGAPAAVSILYKKTGMIINWSNAVRVWTNSFYAGRPTSKYKLINGKLVIRNADEIVFTEGNYPTINTWEEHLALQEAIARRKIRSTKTTAGAWATGIVLCECGQPYISNGKEFYMCRGYRRDKILKWNQSRVNRGLRSDPRLPVSEDWQLTDSCGEIRKKYLHAVVEEILRYAFENGNLSGKIVQLEKLQREKIFDMSDLTRQETELNATLQKLKQREENAEQMRLDGDISRERHLEIKNKIDEERKSIKIRLAKIVETRDHVMIPTADLALINEVVQCQFDDIWYGEDSGLTDQEKALIAQSMISSVRMTKSNGNLSPRRYDHIEYASWIGPLTMPPIEVKVSWKKDKKQT